MTIADTYKAVTKSVNLIASRTYDRASVIWDRHILSVHSPVHGTIETFEAGKHRGRLDKFYVLVQDLRQAVTRSPNNILARFSIAVGVKVLCPDKSTHNEVQLKKISPYQTFLRPS